MRAFEIGLSVLIIVVLPLVSAVSFAADDGAEVFETVCTQCHTADQRPLTDKHLTREEWKAAVAKMAALGAKVPRKQIEVLLDYLARTHGPLSDTDAAGQGSQRKPAQ